MILKPQTAPVFQGEHYLGKSQRTLNYDSKLKIQTTGPGADTIFFEGPPEGKKWTVRINVFVKETDA